jgi:N-acyl-D-amino-acid deacylase
MTTLIKDGILIDPISRVHTKRNLYIKDHKIEYSTIEEPEADCVIDAAGKIVAPGFIDVHMHEGGINSDGTLDESMFLALLNMGVTSALGGNCGNNALASPSEYLDLIDKRGIPVHLGLFAGHTDTRLRAGGTNKYESIDSTTLNTMLASLQKELDSGCAGISLGVKYTPGTTFDELLQVGLLCKKANKPLTAHIREDASGVLSAARELAEIGRQLGIQVEISHIGSMAGFGQMSDTLEMLDEYVLNGTNLGIDCYPYYAFSTGIGETTYDEGWLEHYQTTYSSIELCDGPFRGQRCTEEIFHQLRKEAPETITVCHVMKPEEVDMALLHPNVILVTDGYLNNGQGHPRAAGTFPRFLKNYVCTGKISLDDAIAKMTTLPALKFGLKNKGKLSA